MSMDLARQPLQKIRIQYTKRDVSCALPIEKLIQSLQEWMDQDGSVICWQVHRIIWGKWQAGQVVLSDGTALDGTYLQEIRVFNALEEVHLKKRGNEWQGRYIKDEGPEEGACVDALSPLWGSNESRVCHDGYALLEDRDRKLYQCVPSADEAEFYGLVTRNYIGFNEQTGQAGYVDYRFKAVTSAQGSK